LKNLHSDFLAALSLANLSFIELWDGLLNYTPAQSFFLDHAPPATEYAAAFANVLILGSIFFLLIRLARWIATRLGVLGFIFGSLPLLLLIVLFPAKSVVRLIENRLPDWDLKLVVASLAFIFLVTAAITRRRFFGFASAVLVTISPLLLIEGVLALSRCSTDRSAAYADGPLAPRVPQTSRPRIVWIIFDELDYRLAFVDRPPNVPMRAFDRLREESLFAEDAISPAPDTYLSVPSLITGKPLSSVEIKDSKTALFDGVPANAQPTIFSTAHSMGANAAVVGWYFPYCRIFSNDLAACSAHDLESQLSATGSTFADGLILQQQSLFAYGFRSLLGESPRAKHHIEKLNSMHADALRDAADPSLNLVFLHLPVPHAPYLYDRFTYTFPKHYLSFSSYLDNLALADAYLGDLRQAMTDAGVWDNTTLLVTSDHPDRTSMAVDGREDQRVPFLLKLAGQTYGEDYQPVLFTIVTKPLLEAILDGKITTQEDATNWLAAHPK
jgi:hypothetical protein